MNEKYLDEAIEAIAAAQALKATQVRNRHGRWVEAIPMPLFVGFGFRRCKCGAIRFGTRRYREHYALDHVMDLP